MIAPAASGRARYYRFAHAETAPAAKVVTLVEAEKLSYRLVAKRLDISKNTVTEIMKRQRAARSSKTAGVV